MTENKPFSLRAHHGLCLCFFRGKGYSEEFVGNMTSIVNMLSANPFVTVTSQADVICRACPNNLEGKCASGEKVCEYDRRVLWYCNISEGDVIPYSEFQDRIKNNILLPGKRREICKGCQWDALCGEYEKGAAASE